MKKIFILLVLGVTVWVKLPAQINPVLFDKIYGNAEENRPTVIKAFNDGIYVAGSRFIAGAEYATFTKFDLTTGALCWEKWFELQTHINDFDYEPTQDELFIVGSTTPFASNFNNASFLARISGNGNLMDFQRYQQDGRERFERIVRHPNPINPNAPFYVLGIKNPPTPTPPTGFEEVVLFNVDKQTGGLVWGQQYSLTPPENEFSRGLIPYGNNLILFGNDISNNGVLIQVDGLNGMVINGFTYPHVLDIYDGLELVNGALLITGENFAAHEAFVMTLNPSFATAFGNPPGLQFSNIVKFKDIWQDQFGKLYVIGENKNLTPPFAKNYQVVHKLDLFHHAGNYILSVDWARFLEDLSQAETAYGDGYISVTPAHDRIFYADSRLSNPNGFGNWDMLIGSYDLNLGAPAPCVVDFPHPTTPIFFNQTAVNPSGVSINPPSPVNVPAIKPFMASCNEFCAPAPCDCDFTWTTGNCSQVQFTANCTPAQAGNYTYEWDFDCTGPGLPVTFTVGSPTHSIPFTFPCGGGVFNVCLKVTAPDGTVCNITHVVTVPNICCGQVSGKLDCVSGLPYEYTYTITVTDPPGSTNCAQPVLTVAPPAVLASPVFYNSVIGAVILTGTVSVTDPVPLNLLFTIQTNCVCISTGKPITCTQPLSLPTLCCKEIYVPNLKVCKDDPTLDVPVQVLNGAILNNISSVSWYVMPKPAGGCPSTPWGGVPYQQISSTTLTPLHLLPAYLNGDLCVYAVVTLNDGPCTQITSNIAAMVQFCAPSTCVLTGGSKHCYTGTPIIPGPLNAAISSPPTACTPIWEWYEPGNPNPVQIGGLTFQPITGLSIQNPANCYEDFIYKVVITDACGKHTCTETVRLYNDNAPLGTLTILPPDVPPLCPGEDAVLEYKPACAGEPENWTWYYSTTGPPPPGLIPGAGTANSIYYTNQLFQDTWFMVEKLNDIVCPADQIHLKIDVRDPLVITNFIAQPVPVCDPTGVYMQVDFTPVPPDPPCSVTVEWYKDGNQVGVTPPAAASPSSFTYVPPLGSTIDGNYYCVIINDCCNERDTSQVVIIDPPCFAEIEGPCYMCNSTPVTLSMLIFNLPATTTCTYQWTTILGGNIISPTNLPTVTVDGYGYYCCTATCTDVNNNTCQKTACFDLPQCFNNASGCYRISETGEPLDEPLQVSIFPNPTTGTVTITISPKPLNNGMIRVFDLSGKVMFSENIPHGQDKPVLSLASLPYGMYFVQVLEEGVPVWVGKVVREK